MNDVPPPVKSLGAPKNHEVREDDSQSELLLPVRGHTNRVGGVFFQSLREHDFAVRWRRYSATFQFVHLLFEVPAENLCMPKQAVIHTVSFCLLGLE